MLSNELLKILPAFSNTETTLIDDQSVDDIIKAIQSAQKFYAKDYEKIYPYFVGRDPIDTARNIWDFLKHNVDYVIEPDSLQTIKSPAAIIATGKRGLGGNDCKNYALFTGGLLSAYRDNELKDFELYFRFASYSEYEDTPQHVFVVMVINKKEIWVDAVLDKFNEHREPSYYIDKKIKPMALVALSGMRRLGDDTGGGYEGGYDPYTDYGYDPGYDTSGDTGGDSGDGSMIQDNYDGTYTVYDANGNATDYFNDGTPINYDNGNGFDSVDPTTGSEFIVGDYGYDYWEIEPDGSITHYTWEGDVISDDGSIQHDNGDGKTYTEYDIDGSVTVYNNDGTIASQNPQGGKTTPSRNPAPKAPAAKPQSGGGFASTGGGGASGGGASGGGGGTSSGSSSSKPSTSTKPPTTANTPTDPLNALIKSLSSLLGGKTQKPIVNPKIPAKVSNTGTYLLIGGAALIALILTRKKK